MKRPFSFENQKRPEWAHNRSALQETKSTWTKSFDILWRIDVDLVLGLDRCHEQYRIAFSLFIILNKQLIVLDSIDQLL